MKKYFIAGILVWAPLAVTIWVISWGLGLLDGVFGSVMHAIIVILPNSATSDVQHFRDIPGVGNTDCDYHHYADWSRCH
jgi:uncharacterized membrane protein